MRHPRTSPHATATWPPLLELRQYTLHPGRRDDLIALFDSEFVESQEQLGMGVYGQFRDLDEPNRFVWLRGYPHGDPDARGRALAAFYSGPIWAAHSRAANETMVSSDDVFLLTPISEREPFVGADAHPPVGAVPPGSMVEVTVCLLEQPAERTLLDFISADVVPLLSRIAAAPVAAFASADVPNTFPALPVRGESVVAWVLRFDTLAAHAEYVEQLAKSPRWRSEVWARLEDIMRSAPLRLRLAPTGRSRLQ